MKMEATPYKDAKDTMDFIFCGCLIAAQRIDDIENKDLEIVKVWSALLMNINWCQRIYSIFDLIDTDCGIDNPGAGKDGLWNDLEHISMLMYEMLKDMETTNFDSLKKNSEESLSHYFNVMIDQIYVGLYEVQSMIDMYLHTYKHQ